MADDDIPYWVLISVLSSSFPLPEALALTLHHVAFDLLSRGASEGSLDQELAHGVVKNLKKEALVGTVGGPMFEARVETERGRGEVRFMLTRQGIELWSAREDAKSPPAKKKSTRHSQMLH